MKAPQHGAGMLMVVVLLLTAAAFAVLVAASQSGGDIQATDANADSLQALFLADTGVERALKRFATGTACGALAETITDLSTIGLGTTAYSITLSNGVTTDFAGAALAPNTQCRIAVTARVIASNVTRTLQAIVDRNLLEGPDNPTFDNPLTGATPSGWTSDPANAFAANGGESGTAPACRRAAWTARNNPGAPAQNRMVSATVPVQFTLTAGTTNIWFHRRVVSRTSDCGALPAAGPAWPAACAPAAGASNVCFQLAGTGGAGLWSVVSDAGTSGPGTAACPSTFNPCTDEYLAKVFVSVPMTGATSVNQIRYHLRLQGAGRKEIFVDNIEMTNTTAVGAAYVKVWRDCSTVANPVTCV